MENLSKGLLILSIHLLTALYWNDLSRQKQKDNTVDNKHLDTVLTACQQYPTTCFQTLLSRMGILAVNSPETFLLHSHIGLTVHCSDLLNILPQIVDSIHTTHYTYNASWFIFIHLYHNTHTHTRTLRATVSPEALVVEKTSPNVPSPIFTHRLMR